MIYSTATVAVNPRGGTPLTSEQVWKGLERKAREAQLFLPPGLCTRCDVTEESDAHFVREATISCSHVPFRQAMLSGVPITPKRFGHS